jgi:hypothetical protein
MTKDNESIIKIISLEDSQKVLEDLFKKNKKTISQISLPDLKNPKALVAHDISAVNIGDTGLSKGVLIFEHQGKYNLATMDKSPLRAGWILASDKTRTFFINSQKAGKK